MCLVEINMVCNVPQTTPSSVIFSDISGWVFGTDHQMNAQLLHHNRIVVDNVVMVYMHHDYNAQ